MCKLFDIYTKLAARLFEFSCITRITCGRAQIGTCFAVVAFEPMAEKIKLKRSQVLNPPYLIPGCHAPKISIDQKFT
ncbi:hypothetical protein D1AOALGA4SA_931 [Olavius algarvensis Delta 1 endosymbiont]|nr:hypothetical protein D1AOALGA4SA_931 [Olavius algarvensis Delta 1 endosymbiont]